MDEIEKYLRQIIDIDTEMVDKYSSIKEDIESMEAKNHKELQSMETKTLAKEKTALKESYDADIKKAEQESRELLDETSAALAERRTHYLDIKDELIKKMTEELLLRGRVHA